LSKLCYLIDFFNISRENNKDKIIKDHLNDAILENLSKYLEENDKNIIKIEEETKNDTNEKVNLLTKNSFDNLRKNLCELTLELFYSEDFLNSYKNSFIEFLDERFSSKSL